MEFFHDLVTLLQAAKLIREEVIPLLESAHARFVRWWNDFRKNLKPNAIKFINKLVAWLEKIKRNIEESCKEDDISSYFGVAGGTVELFMY